MKLIDISLNGCLGGNIPLYFPKEKMYCNAFLKHAFCKAHQAQLGLHQCN